MILNFSKYVAEITEHKGDAMKIAMTLASVYSEGMAFERKRVLNIIARKALNATELRNEINRPVR